MKTEEQKKKQREATARYRATHAPKPMTAEQKKKRAAYARHYRATHPEYAARSNEYNKRYRAEHPEQVKAWFDKRPKDAKRRWWNLRGQSKYRELECTIDFEQYVKIIGDGTCFYCKRRIPETLGHQLDRKDNAKGYTPDNVVPCCFDCNRIKGEVISFEEMCYIIPLLMEFRKAHSTESGL